MRVKQLTIERYRGISSLKFCPGPRCVILGPNNSGKSTILEALDLLLHPGFGRPRPAPSEIDYFERDTGKEFYVEAVLGDLAPEFRAEVCDHLEGWKQAELSVVPEPDGEGVEPVVRVRARGTTDLDLIHEFAKPESEGQRFGRGLRQRLGWIFDGRVRDPVRELAFYQGGALERLFAGTDLSPAVDMLKAALGAGAKAVNEDATVDEVLRSLEMVLQSHGLATGDGPPLFELGGVTKREVLQSLRLALPASSKVNIPLSRQGRGAQRLILVAVLLRLAERVGCPPIAGFEEPEEALEPLRQVQVARMLGRIAERGQVFVVTHSPDIARGFGVDDFILLREGAAGRGVRELRRELAAATRQTYERWLDGPLVRGLFARAPVLVEGPGDRAAFQVFWQALVDEDQLVPAAQLGLDFLNCEGASNMPMVAAVLRGAGKAVVAWPDRDKPDVLKAIERLRTEKNCACIVLYGKAQGWRNLEELLSTGVPIAALCAGLEALATDRGYSWEDQRDDLLSRWEDAPTECRECAKSASSVAGFLGALPEPAARALAARALGAKRVSPFEMKGGRQGRILAETIVKAVGVPLAVAGAFVELRSWLEGGCTETREILLVADG
jgi:putative ATP-dependent endonuclease of OLD family